MRGKGWLRDPHLAGVALHTNARTLLGTSEPPDQAMGLLDKAPPIWDQGQYSACVGFAWARLLSTMDGRIFSPWAVYALARMVYEPGAPLRDEGSMPHSAAMGIDEWGVALHSEWPFEGINAKPGLAELEGCEKFQSFKPLKIYGTGEARSLQVRRALSTGHPVVFGIDVDQRFEDYSGGVLPYTAGDLGGHYLCALGYDTSAAGTVTFIGQNSWSESWGERGEFRFDESFLDGVSDLYIAEIQ